MNEATVVQLLSGAFALLKDDSVFLDPQLAASITCAVHPNG
ncbi:MAG: hypothetical protein AB7I59_04395 [Geminicoccaceae bacterium]